MNFNTILNILYPPTCIFCNAVMDYKTEICVCDNCIQDLPILPSKHCEICCEPLDIEYGDLVCNHCKKNSYYFDGVISPYIYENKVRQSIIRLKFYKHINYAKTMAYILSGQLLKTFSNTSFDLIIPVPISKKRFANRQYNQCELIAKKLSKMLHITYCKDILYKVKDIAKQSTLAAKNRKQNVKNAYKILNGYKLQAKRILLIDDTTTTRATLNECAKMLKNNGASLVICAVFAVSTKEIINSKNVEI